jgi:hypothetical protein
MQGKVVSHLADSPSGSIVLVRQSGEISFSEFIILMLILGGTLLLLASQLFIEIYYRTYGGIPFLHFGFSSNYWLILFGIVFVIAVTYLLIRQQ